MRDIDRFVRRNKSLRMTDPGYLVRETIEPGELQEIYAEDAAFPPKLQLPCLERRISFFESDLPVVKRQANGWALSGASTISMPSPCRTRDPILASIFSGGMEG